MYIITLSLTEKKSEAAAHMAAHNEWIAQGFEDGVFLLVGSLKPQGGGAILATSDDRSEIEDRLATDSICTRRYCNATDSRNFASAHRSATVLPEGRRGVSDLFIGPDGCARCRWSGAAPEFLDYHDREWGFPVAGRYPTVREIMS